MSDLLLLSARRMPLPGSPNIAENQIVPTLVKASQLLPSVIQNRNQDARILQRGRSAEEPRRLRSR